MRNKLLFAYTKSIKKIKLLVKKVNPYFFLGMPILIVAFGFLAYWLFIRPSQIRSYCFDKVQKAADEERSKGGTLSRGRGNNLYRICLADHGMKPENLTD